MISLIIGRRGSGKTKHLIELVEETVRSSDGNVVCIEKEPKLTYDVNYRVRLIDTDHYAISGYDAFYGFLCGVCAGDHDITDILIDATLRIGGRDYEQLADFLKKADTLCKTSHKKFTFTISADKAELPERIFDFCTIL
ncbi:MAG: hypothetical protein FWF05_04865 [Oscillospiraceae bacterium]|nr:hypothetical protein [Oscillospiraceae bacterium]